MARSAEHASFRFRDRHHAGLALAEKLTRYRERSDVVVLGLPRGGIPVAFEVALALRAPLDVFVVRKLGWPGHEEFAMGAIASGGVRVLNPNLSDVLHTRLAMVDQVAEREQAELTRREQLYRAGRAPIALTKRCVILIDDGLATGSSMLAAAFALRRQRPARIVIAVPVASTEACARMQREADDVVCAVTPEPFDAVGCWYEDFSQTSDAEVEGLLARSREGSGPHRMPQPPR